MDKLKRNLPIVLVLVAGAALFYFVLRRPAKTLEYGATDDQEALELVTLLPRDAIPAIDEPLFYDADEADLEYAPDELVLGVSINGDHRAYSTSKLNGHEIVNDTVGGQPIAVTW